MKIENINRQTIIISLLHECNFLCPHCGIPDTPSYLGYELSFEQLKLCLADLCRLEGIKWVNFSGGEPTLWEEEHLDLVDLLIEISKENFSPSFITNGSYFDDYSQCCSFFEKYFGKANKSLRVRMSIDTYHNNFNAEKERSHSLDNIKEYKKGISHEKQEMLRFRVTTMCSKDFKPLLPSGMMTHYESLGVKFDLGPVKIKGRAKSLKDRYPDTNKNISTDIFNILLYDNNYYFAPLISNGYHRFARLGELQESDIENYLNKT